jgi:hypothetical protein
MNIRDAVTEAALSIGSSNYSDFISVVRSDNTICRDGHLIELQGAEESNRSSHSADGRRGEGKPSSKEIESKVRSVSETEGIRHKGKPLSLDVAIIMMV